VTHDAPKNSSSRSSSSSSSSVTVTCSSIPRANPFSQNVRSALKPTLTMRALGSLCRKNREERAAPHAETTRHLREPQRPHATGRRPRAKLFAADSVNKHDVEALAIDASIAVIVELLLQQG
jgi:hypothetical protein